MAEFTADNLVELVELNGEENTDCSRGGVVDLHSHGGLRRREGGREGGEGGAGGGKKNAE